MVSWDNAAKGYYGGIEFELRLQRGDQAKRRLVIGWVREVAGVNAQARTREELLDDLSVALREALEMNCRDAEAAMMEDYEQVTIQA